MQTTSKIAIIGLGNIGQAIAGNLSKSQTPFIAADRTLSKAKQLSEKWQSATVSPISNALNEAQIIILSIPYSEIGGFINENLQNLEGKIIIDPSNAIAPDKNGGFKKIIEEYESAGEINANFLPENAKLVKALGTLGVTSLSNSAFANPEKSVLFYASDNENVDSEIENLIQNIGFEPLKIGGINQSSRIEVFGDLHEFGALGKSVTLTEAKQKI